VDERLSDWVMRRLPLYDPNESFGPCAALGVWNGSEIMAAMVVYGYSRRKGQCHIAMAADNPKWATKSVIAALLKYPFLQLGCRRVTTYTASKNERALRFNRGIGFKQEGVMRWGYGDDDCVIMGLLREEADRWLQLDQPSDTNVAYSMAANAG
jgi:RimJ/RimL family protein N-acetyltransferase